MREQLFAEPRRCVSLVMCLWASSGTSERARTSRAALGGLRQKRRKMYRISLAVQSQTDRAWLAIVSERNRRLRNRTPRSAEAVSRLQRKHTPREASTRISRAADAKR